MALGIYRKFRTFEICFLYLLYNMINVKSLETNRSKESYFVIDHKTLQKNYRFEDFFWTGSGDGPLIEGSLGNYTEPKINEVDETSFETWRTTTVFHTTTILFATVYPNIGGCPNFDCIPQISPFQTESVDYSLPSYPFFDVPDISPSPTLEVSFSTTLKLPDTFLGSEEAKNGFEKSNTGGNSGTTTLSTSNSTSSSVDEPNATVFPFNEDRKSIPATVFPEISTDQKYLLLTVLKNESFLPEIHLNSTENKLSTLYKKAYHRRQEKYLGGNEYSERRDRKISELIKVHIVNVTHIGNDIGIIYSVTVAGKPVPAITAANDMRLMTTSEVIAELGHPILSKAEPYNKAVIPPGARIKGRARDTWLLIGSVIAALVLIMVLFCLLAIGLSKNKRRKNSGRTTENKQQVFEVEAGSCNFAYEEDSDVKTKSHAEESERKLKCKNGSHNTTVKFVEEERRGSTTSSDCSGSSENSLVRLRQQIQKSRKRIEKDERPKPKPRARFRRIQSSDCNSQGRRDVLSASSVVSRNTFDESVTEGCSPQQTRSPTSYLSMPSVKAFPRRPKIPEPLNKVLEPTSIRHLDADSDSPRDYPLHMLTRRVEVDVEKTCEIQKKFVGKKGMTRHASLEGDDPGFIGPVVWNRHCQRINESETDILNVEEENFNVGKMRKRFNELLDDALSMFGSRNVSPEGSDIVLGRQPDNRIHSAVIRPIGLEIQESFVCRPKTTEARRPKSSVIRGPKGAWETPSCSTLGRPVSAGVFRTTTPTVEKKFINANSELLPNDPAVPLIAAIKCELKKFEDPSTSKC